MNWAAKRLAAERAHAERLGASVEGEREDLRLAGIAGASWAAGLAALMAGDERGAKDLLHRAADEYVTSWREAPPGSWGRPIAAIRSRLIADDVDRARAEAEAALGEGAEDAAGPIAAYCAALALLVVDRDADARNQAERALGAGLEPAAVGRALVALANGDAAGLAAARRDVLRSFEERDAFLEDIPVADTVLVIDTLARARDVPLEALPSGLLPSP